MQRKYKNHLMPCFRPIFLRFHAEFNALFGVVIFCETLMHQNYFFRTSKNFVFPGVSKRSLYSGYWKFLNTNHEIRSLPQQVLSYCRFAQDLARGWQLHRFVHQHARYWIDKLIRRLEKNRISSFTENELINS